ncbi:porin [Herbaspirillum sp. BH-1]|uniref:porin n=1 Tax=Herbaspirillum sp. (strain BH-1) TaxID=2058884 RepID=UPI000C888711|nr:porin [Herbaspirillum sp. BH-1]PLY59555.1 porin [Herbaspirillum sp. BH-1]
MQKIKWKFGAIAALATLPVASWAQSSVTISGIMDAGVSYVSNESGKSNLRADNGIGVPSILFIKGQEDLGGGTAAIFQLESQFNLSTGASLPGNNLIFGRQSLVGLRDNKWGTLTAGNQYEFMHDSLLFGGFDSALTYGGYYTFRQGPFNALAVPNNPTGASDFDRLAGLARVANSVKYLSPDFNGVTFGGMYGLGEVAGDTSASRTISLGTNYASGAFGLAAAYTDARYSTMSNGHDGIRNWGLGARYRIGDYKLNLLYTNTRNTLTKGEVNVYQAGVNWQMDVAWNLGVSYEYMKGNAQLAHNYAHQGNATLQYWLSKRTDIYLQTVYQKAGGDNATTQAWINGLYGPGSASSTGSQAIFRIGMATRF